MFSFSGLLYPDMYILSFSYSSIPALVSAPYHLLWGICVQFGMLLKDKQKSWPSKNQVKAGHLNDTAFLHLFQIVASLII